VGATVLAGARWLGQTAHPGGKVIMHVAAQSDRGRVRTTNEDCVLVNAGLGLLILADGMGGRAGGAVASALAVETVAMYVQTHLTREASADQRLALLEAALRTANTAIETEARASRPLRGMGTTVVVALCQATQVHLAHVGDSRAYLFQHGRLRQVTTDHSIVAALLQTGQLTPRQARTHAGRHQLTRWLGGRASTPALCTVTWAPGDILLLCSDGLTTMVADRPLATLLRHGGGDLEATCAALVTRANVRGGVDNISVILAQHTDARVCP
jgi:serine/threonine protein phosphatase PrpC